jgi:uncharacterized integral membrane protein
MGTKLSSEPREVSFLGFDRHMPFAVAMLFAAVGAVLFAATAANSRMVQLRGGASPWKPGSGQRVR